MEQKIARCEYCDRKIRKTVDGWEHAATSLFSCWRERLEYVAKPKKGTVQTEAVHE